MKLFTALLFFFAVVSRAQDRSNQLNGTFVLGPAAKLQVEFTLIWTEENGKIFGNYRDNNFARFAKVYGTSESTGRLFKIVLPEVVKGAKTITMMTSNVKPKDANLQVSAVIVFRDVNGNPIAIRETHAVFTAIGAVPAKRTVAESKVVQREEARKEVRPKKCMARMGDLSGHCGTYRGLISEEADASNSCNLLLADQIALGLDSERNIRLYLSSPDPILNPPTHLLRQLPPAPEKRIDVTVRSCGILPAVAFSGNPQSCKLLNLSGTFSTFRTRKSFIGFYTIYDERSRRFCRYRLSLEKD